MTKLFLLAAAIAASAAAPAFARETKPAEPTTTEASQTATTTTKAQPREQRYCIVETITGSHIPRRSCKTRADWMLDGFDPTAK